MKFALEWLSDFVDVAAAGRAEGARRLLDQAGIPVESIAGSGKDAILDAEITPNRPDAMGHRGLAREISAMSGQPMRDREIAERYAGHTRAAVQGVAVLLESALHRVGVRFRVPAEQATRMLITSYGAAMKAHVLSGEREPSAAIFADVTALALLLTERD